MKTLKFKIELEAKLIDALSDYLIGVHNAATEVGVSDGGGSMILQAFAEMDLDTVQEADRLACQIGEYGRELADLFRCAPPVVAVEFIEDQDWSENWKAHFKPFAIVPGLVITPTWEQYKAREGEQVIVMDPGMAFGTGHHETTRLCLELLQESESIISGCTVLDVGTGTGILAMASLLFGADRVVSVDNDLEAIRVARENSRLNNLSGRMEVSAAEIKNIETPFACVVANIVHDVLLELADDLARLTEEGGTLVLSGLLEGDQSDNLVHCFEQRTFHLKQKRTAGQWCSLLFEKSAPEAA